jgi:hypothetical protein
MKYKKDKKSARGGKKAYSAEASSNNNEGESDEDDEDINAYRMRVVWNSGYG